MDTVDLDIVRRDDAYLDDLGDGAPPDEGDLLGAMLAAWQDEVATTDSTTSSIPRRFSYVEDRDKESPASRRRLALSLFGLLGGPPAAAR